MFDVDNRLTLMVVELCSVILVANMVGTLRLKVVWICSIARRSAEGCPEVAVML